MERQVSGNPGGNYKGLKTRTICEQWAVWWNSISFWNFSYEYLVKNGAKEKNTLWIARVLSEDFTLLFLAWCLRHLDSSTSVRPYSSHHFPAYSQKPKPIVWKLFILISYSRAQGRSRRRNCQTPTNQLHPLNSRIVFANHRRQKCDPPGVKQGVHRMVPRAHI